MLYEVFNLLNVRSRETSVFSRQTFTNGALWSAVAVASSVLWVEEVRKAVSRWRSRRAR